MFVFGQRQGVVQIRLACLDKVPPNVVERHTLRRYVKFDTDRLPAVARIGDELRTIRVLHYLGASCESFSLV